MLGCASQKTPSEAKQRQLDSLLQSPVTAEVTVLTVSWGSPEHIYALSTLSLLLSLSNKLVPPQGGEWDKFRLFVNLFLACLFASSFLCWEFWLVWSEGKKYKEECAGNTKDGQNLNVMYERKNVDVCWWLFVYLFSICLAVLWKTHVCVCVRACVRAHAWIQNCCMAGE